MGGFEIYRTPNIGQRVVCDCYCARRGRLSAWREWKRRLLSCAQPLFAFRFYFAAPRDCCCCKLLFNSGLPSCALSKFDVPKRAESLLLLTLCVCVWTVKAKTGVVAADINNGPGVTTIIQSNYTHSQTQTLTRSINCHLLFPVLFHQNVHENETNLSINHLQFTLLVEVSLERITVSVSSRIRLGWDALCWPFSSFPFNARGFFF
jgi:hypothetical protein